MGDQTENPNHKKMENFVQILVLKENHISLLLFGMRITEIGVYIFSDIC